jgi:hypothetical protein
LQQERNDERHRQKRQPMANDSPGKRALNARVDEVFRATWLGHVKTLDTGRKEVVRHLMRGLSPATGNRTFGKA